MDKPFWLYVGSIYYPTAAGFSDFKGAYETQDAAIEAGRATVEEGCWWYVVEVTGEGPKFLSNGWQAWDEESEEELLP